MTALGLSSGLLAAVAVAAFVGGIAVLIARMSTQRDPFDPDDGAVV
jgi:cation transporter-like permease